MKRTFLCRSLNFFDVYQRISLGINKTMSNCRDYHTIISTSPTYKKDSSNWTYQPNTSIHAYSKVDMFPISEPHCPFILHPANSSSTSSTLKQKISKAAYSTIVLSMLPHWIFTICCLLSTALYRKGFQAFLTLLIKHTFSTWLL